MSSSYNNQFVTNSNVSQILFLFTFEQLITTVLVTTYKTCALDPLPADRLKDKLVFIVTLDTNESLEDAVVPTPFKHAIVRPLLTKPSFNKDVLNNYRPVSNLTHLFIVFQKVVALRISNFLIRECMWATNRRIENIIRRTQPYCALSMPWHQPRTTNNAHLWYQPISVLLLR